MNDNNTVHQLNEALNELLNAYDRLKSENEALKDTNEQLEKNLAIKTRENEDLEERIIALTNTTEHHTNEIDTMLGRIKSILGNSSTNSYAEETSQSEEYIAQEDEIESEIVIVTQNEFGKNSQTTMNIDDDIFEEEEKKEKETDIDFSRVQSFINGLNK